MITALLLLKNWEIVNHIEEDDIVTKKIIGMNDEWHVDSIYSFFNKKAEEFPLMKQKDKIEYFAKYLSENNSEITEDGKTDVDMIEHLLHDDPQMNDIIPVISDTEDIDWIVREWAKDNLPDNQAIWTEYVDDNNCGLIRIIVFDVSGKNV